jgi:hypothetical protein
MISVARLAAVLCFALATNSSAEPRSVIPDLFTTPQVQFGTGHAGPNGPLINPALPDVPGPPSGWYLAQWRKPQLLSPDKMIRDDETARDQLLGIPLYSFATPASRLDIYQRPNRHYTFGLMSKGGAHTISGGTNVFLATEELKDATFDHPLDYHLTVTMPIASVSASEPNDIATGTVGAQVMTGFVLRLNDPEAHHATSYFLQINHTDSRNRLLPFRTCYMDRALQRLVVVTPASATFPFAHFAKPPKQMEVSMNDLLCNLVSQPFMCPAPDGRRATEFPASAHDPKNWSISSMYVGLETQVEDARAGAHDSVRRNSEVSLRIFDLGLTSDRSVPFSFASCAKQ